MGEKVAMKFRKKSMKISGHLPPQTRKLVRGKIVSTKAYKKWAKQVSKTESPTGPLRQRKKSQERSEDLYAIIAQRQNKRRSKIDTMFSNLIHNYGGGEDVPEPNEEEFEAARRKLNSRKKSKQK